MPPIVEPGEVGRLLASGADVVLLDARPSADAYARGHLRGAIHADLETDLSGARASGFHASHGGRHPLPSLDQWRRTLGTWGIGPATRVIVYDDQSGANAAARAWWMLRSVGHENVALLDGGYSGAVGAGLEVTVDAVDPDTRGPYPGESWQWPTVDMHAVDRLRHDRTWKVLDVRSRERFRGETEPIDPVAGHIPGAINLPYADNLREGRFKAPALLRVQYESLLGDTPPQHLVVHCGSGVTACHTLVALELAGMPGASLYVGSWGEWCRNPMPQARDE
jgi:thiosulfate/3-mercaptopyruvate sulfurtransferase